MPRSPNVSSHRRGIFISYARDDDEAFAKRLWHDLEPSYRPRSRVQPSWAWLLWIRAGWIRPRRSPEKHIAPSSQEGGRSRRAAGPATLDLHHEGLPSAFAPRHLRAAALVEFWSFGSPGDDAVSPSAEILVRKIYSECEACHTAFPRCEEDRIPSWQSGRSFTHGVNLPNDGERPA
jgi:hypothetical protein